MKACIFVDSEYFRHTINKLFVGYGGYRKEDYLPKTADWEKFFDHLVDKAKTGEMNITRLRTYWYAIDEVETWPYLPSPRQLVNWATENKDPIQRDEKLKAMSNIDIIDELLRRKTGIENRFAGYRKIQRGIAWKHHAIEFKNSGTISYDLFNKKLGREKTVDVNLAMDMLQMRNFYDMAIIVSGDQDYLPAIQAVKNSGVIVVNVSFNDCNKKRLPGVSRRLNETTDWSLTVDYETFAGYMGFKI